MNASTLNWTKDATDREANGRCCPSRYGVNHLPASLERVTPHLQASATTEPIMRQPRPLRPHFPAMVADVHVKCEEAIRTEFAARKAAEAKLKKARAVIRELRRALEFTWETIPEGRAYLKKMDEALFD